MRKGGERREGKKRWMEWKWESKKQGEVEEKGSERKGR